MSAASTSAGSAVGRGGPPDQRTPDRSTAADRAASAHGLLRQAWSVLRERVAGLDEDAFRAPSLLPGWSRAHLVSHLARSADALVNLLTWARTGIEHPAYPSRADRDADIEAGADRLAQVIREDLGAACDRFHVAVEGLADDQWSATVAHYTGRAFPAEQVVEMALFEAWNHLVDLDVGVGYADVPDAALERLLDHAVRPHLARVDGEPVVLVAELAGGAQRRWELAIAAAPGAEELRGSGTAVLAWLTRGDASGISGEPPELAAWG